MAISNKFGLMVVTTGNKSEMSVGYATLYGDMNGGFNPIKDLYKTEVFRLTRAAQHLEAGRRARARRRRDPGAHHHQAADRRACARTRRTRTRCRPTTCSTRILERLVEREEPVADIVAAGFDARQVLRVDRMLNLAEYKRRQAAPGVKVTLRNFGRDRRYPIMNKFRDPGTPLPKPDETRERVSTARRARRSIFDDSDLI